MLMNKNLESLCSGISPSIRMVLCTSGVHKVNFRSKINPITPLNHCFPRISVITEHVFMLYAKAHDTF